MGSHIFDPFCPISIIRSLCYFEISCDANGISNGAAIWLFIVFMKKLASVVLKIRFASKHNAQTSMRPFRKTTKLSTLLKAVKYLLRPYATDKNIARTDDKITMFSHPPSKTSLQCGDELDANAVRCEDV